MHLGGLVITATIYCFQIWRVIKMTIVPFQAFADSSHGGIVERHVLCAQRPMHLVESAASLATVGCTVQ